MSREYRFNPEKAQVEQRDGESPRIVGYAAKFYREDDPGTEFRLGRDAVERIAPGAFDTNDDVRGLFNHDSNYPLGRNKSGTMTLTVDEVGLRYEIDPPKNAVAEMVVEALQRGDVDGSSFGFTVNEDGQEWRTENGQDVRYLRSVKLYDVGPVTYPAYEAATSGARSLDGYEDYKARKTREADKVNFIADCAKLST